MTELNTRYNEGFATLPSNPIVKLVYKHEFFDVNRMKIGARTITTITSDGNIVIRRYKSDSRKAYATHRAICSHQMYDDLCKQLDECISTSDRWSMYVDDCSETLRIIYKHGREQIVDRGLGNKDANIATIVYKYMRKLRIDL